MLGGYLTHKLSHLFGTFPLSAFIIITDFLTTYYKPGTTRYFKNFFFVI